MYKLGHTDFTSSYFSSCSKHQLMQLRISWWMRLSNGPESIGYLWSWILVLAQGRHEELLLNPNGAYKELVSKQLHSGGESGNGENQTGTVGESSGNMVPMASKLDLDEPSSSHPSPVAPAGKGYFARAMALNRPELQWAVVGVLGAALNGALWPVSSDRQRRRVRKGK